jgi:hypothetical protein
VWNQLRISHAQHLPGSAFMAEAIRFFLVATGLCRDAFDWLVPNLTDLLVAPDWGFALLLR